MEKQPHLMVSRRSESTLYMQANMMADSNQDLLQMDISPKELVESIYSGVVSLRSLRMVFSYPSSMIWKSGE